MCSKCKDFRDPNDPSQPGEERFWKEGERCRECDIDQVKDEVLRTASGITITGLPKASFSISRYQAFKKCGEAYRRKYIEGIRTPLNANVIRSSTVKAGIYHALRTKMAGRTPILSDVLSWMMRVHSQDVKKIEVWDGETPAEMEDFVTSAYKAWHASAIMGINKVNPVAVEKHFFTSIGDIPFSGTVDYIDKTEVGPCVVLIKVSKKKAGDTQIEKDTKLTLYAGMENQTYVRLDQLIARPITKTRKSAFVEYLPEMHTRSDQDFHILKEDIQETTQLIRLGVFPKASIDSWACSTDYCGHYSNCRGRKNTRQA